MVRLTESWPTVHQCCWCLGLRSGAMVGAAAGVVWGAAHVTLYALMDRCMLGRAHGALGVLVVGVYTLVAGATWRRSRALLELFLWSVAALWAGLLVVAVAGTVVAAQEGDELATFASLPIAFLIIVASLYHNVVVANFIMTQP